MKRLTSGTCNALIKALRLTTLECETQLAMLLDYVCSTLDGKPDRSTVDRGALPEVRRLERKIKLGRAALTAAKAEGVS